MLDLKTSLLEDILGEYSKFDVASHNDTDGITALLSFLRMIPSNTDSNIFTINNSNRTFEQPQLDRMYLSKDSALFILDLGSSSKDQLIFLSESYGSVVNIDHHVPIKFKHSNFNLINPHTMNIDDPDHYSAGYMCHLMNPDKPWLGLLSLVGDNVDKNTRYLSFMAKFSPQEKVSARNLSTILNSVFNAEPLGTPDVIKADDDFSKFILKTRHYVEQSDSAEQYLHKLEENHPEIIERYNSLSSDIERNVMNIVKNMDSEKIKVFEVDSKIYHIAQQVQKKVEKFKPEGTLVIYQVDEQRDKVRIMVSTTDTSVNCRELINDCPYVDGGGHIAAAGSWGNLEDMYKALIYFQN